MRSARILLTLFVFAMIDASCQPATEPPVALPTTQSLAEPIPTPTDAVVFTPTALPAATATQTRIPATASNTPTPTPGPANTPSLTPTLEPTKPVFISFSLGGGDGGSPVRYYLGAGVPDFTLYADGQIIFREGNYSSYDDDAGYILRESYLTDGEMCALYSTIHDTGFFEVEGEGWAGVDDPIYGEFDDNVVFSEGGPSYVIIVNGPTPKEVHIYYAYANYTIPEVKAVFDLLHHFTVNTTTPFQPDSVMLWIDEVVEPEGQSAHDWPAILPLLSDLLPLMDYESYKGVLILENVDILMELFDYHLKAQLFSEGDHLYQVIASPLLPHERSQDYPRGSNVAAEFKLPFACDLAPSE